MARVDVRWLGHASFHISGAGADVLVDPWLTAPSQTAPAIAIRLGDRSMIAAAGPSSRGPLRNGGERSGHK